jgi:hypothetical protein
MPLDLGISMRLIRRPACGLAALVVLSACGGGGDGTAADTEACLKEAGFEPTTEKVPSLDRTEIHVELAGRNKAIIYKHETEEQAKESVDGAVGTLIEVTKGVIKRDGTTVLAIAHRPAAGTTERLEDCM